MNKENTNKHVVGYKNNKNTNKNQKNTNHKQNVKSSGSVVEPLDGVAGVINDGMDTHGAVKPKVCCSSSDA
jgi:hypothetical protein